MTKIEEVDMMVCRACGNQERASEGYPCRECGTFICIMCSNRGTILCTSCQDKVNVPPLPQIPS